MSKTIQFIYRDGANYKWFPNIKISDAKIKELEEKYGEKLKEGTEVFYDSDLGITQDDFHEQRGYGYDDEIDHNILEVTNILSEEEAQKEPVSFYIDCDENDNN